VDYATFQSQKSKEDPALIDRRKRLLLRFLQRICSHPLLSAEHVLHRFLDPNTSWVGHIM
jgi:hypothetical protein